MKLESFRGVLLKKCQDDSLQNLIKFVRDDVLTDLVIDSLQKMADAKHKGDTANVAIRNFGAEMDPETHPDMIRDALGHHASRYKAALKAGRESLANDHARNFFQIVNLAKRTEKHTDGKLHVDAVSPHAWERNAKSRQYGTGHPMVVSGKRKPGDFVTDTKGWAYSGKDYSFLQQAPHETYSQEIRRHGHNDAYPMEHTKINGKYIHIEDIPEDELKGKVKHEFDHHPIMEHGLQHASKRSPEDDVRYDKEALEFDDSHHMESYWDRHDKLAESDPEAYAGRGNKPSHPVHAAVENPLDLSREDKVPDKGTKTATASKLSAAPKTVTRKKKEDISPEQFIDSIKNHPTMSDDMKNSIIESYRKTHGK